MKTIKITMMVLVCVLITNVAMAITPEHTKIQKEKSEVLNKIRRAASATSFTDYMRTGQSELIVLRCTVNEDNEVVVSKVIGFNQELMEAVKRRMAKKKIKTSAALTGEELALRLNFSKIEK